MYTGKSLEGLCHVCVAQKRKAIYADAHDVKEVVARWLSREHSQEVILAEMWGEPLEDLGFSGICDICKRPLDEHKLVYSEEHYCQGICAKKKKAAWKS